MTEREFNRQFVENFKLQFPRSYATLIPEHPRRQNQPFDILVIHNGVVHCMECKRHHGVFNSNLLSDEQWTTHDKIIKSGGNYHIVLYDHIDNIYYCDTFGVKYNLWNFSWVR